MQKFSKDFQVRGFVPKFCQDLIYQARTPLAEGDFRPLTIWSLPAPRSPVLQPLSARRLSGEYAPGIDSEIYNDIRYEGYKNALCENFAYADSMIWRCGGFRCECHFFCAKAQYTTTDSGQWHCPYSRYAKGPHQVT